MKSEKLKKAPLALVLAQLRFSPIVSMSKYIPEIQETFRKLGFPFFSEEHVQTLVFGAGVGVSNSQRPIIRWTFLSTEKKESIILTENFIVIESANYDVFAVFLKKINMAIKVVHDLVGIQLIEQVGLRYVNIITSNSNKEPILSFSASLHGIRLDSIEGLNKITNYHRSHGETTNGEMIIQVAESIGEGFLPPDLVNTKVEIVFKPKIDETFVILDLDHISKRQFQFKHEELDPLLDVMHDSIENAFRSIITQETLELWK